MKNIEKISKVLNFYTYANKLKDISSSLLHSCADRIYGSCILALAYNSEISNIDVSKIIKMELFCELSHIDGFDTVINSMKQKEKIESLINEYKDNESHDSILAHNFRVLDALLTKISDQSTNMVEFINEANKYLDRFGIEGHKNILEFYYYNSVLKTKIRSGWDKFHWNIKQNGMRIETIADHIIGCISLSYALGSEFEYPFSIDEAIKVILIHEIGESIIGDITPFDKVSKEEKMKKEHQAMKKVLSGLKMCDELYLSLIDFDDALTPMNKFCHLCDKLEADIQSKIYQEKNLHNSLNNQKNNVVMKSSKVKQMIHDGLAETAFDIWFYYDKSIYEHEDMEEFYNILKAIKDNDILKHEPLKEVINLTRQEYEFIVNEIGIEIQRLKQDSQIDAIVLTPIQNEKSGIIKIEVLTNKEDDEEEYLKSLTEYINSKNKTAIKVIFTEKYDYLVSSQSTILFDRFSFLKEENTQNVNVVDYNPPIEKKLKQQ